MKKFLIILALLAFVFCGCKTTDVTVDEETQVDETFIEDTAVQESPVEPSDFILIPSEITEEPAIAEETEETEKSDVPEEKDVDLSEEEKTEPVTQTEKESDPSTVIPENPVKQPEAQATKPENKKTEKSSLDSTQKNDVPSYIVPKSEDLEVQNPKFNPEAQKLNNPTKTEIQDYKPSREVSVKNGQNLVVCYPGSGWIYLGETDNQGVVYFLEKSYVQGQTEFKLLISKEGCSMLHFYKVDNLSSTYIDDYLSVKSEGFDESHTVVLAPDFKYDSFLLKKAVNDKKNSNVVQTVTTETAETEVIVEEPSIVFMDEFEVESENKTDESIDEPFYFSSSDELLKEAKKLYAEKQFPKALELVDYYIEKFSSDLDQAYYLKGQILEEKSEVRNIKDSLYCYSTVVDNYPLSDLWDSANERAIYLKRFYFNIR